MQSKNSAVSSEKRLFMARFSCLGHFSRQTCFRYAILDAMTLIGGCTMTEPATSNKREFIICLSILATIYSCGTLLYYSQSFLLFRFYDKGIVTEMLSGWNYLAQAAGIFLFAILFRFSGGLSGKRTFQAVVSMTLLPIITVSIFTRSGPVLIVMMFLLNLEIGMQTAFAFSLIASYITEKRFAICFAGAYSIGGLITCLICRLNEEIMVSFFVIILSCVFVGVISALILFYKDIDFAPASETAEHILSGGNISNIALLHLVIALMAMILALGSNDPILVESGSRIELIYTRIFYAGGLLLAAVIFDRNHTIGSICALASILYPIMLIILYKELPIHYIAVGLIDTFSAFYSVFRAGTYFSLAAEKHRPYIAPFGLCISRIVEGIMCVCLAVFGFDRLTCFILAGVLFVPLIILFCYSLTKNGQTDPSAAAEITAAPEEVPKISFGELYQLTRREEQISAYLAENKTNSEIAAILFVSESTVRFHVSNILKKTGMKNRSEVGRKYNEQKGQ